MELDTIVVEERLSSGLDEEKVEALAISMGDSGLQVPILVHPYHAIDPDHPDRWGEPDGGRFRLVAGAHRLEAARRLGWKTIETLVLYGAVSPHEVRLIEVEENLMRAELTPLDRARFHACHKDLYERVFPETRHGGNRKSGEFRGDTQNTEVVSRSFTAAAAARTGKSQRAVQRGIEIGNRLSNEDAKVLAETPLAHRESDLYRLAKMPAEKKKEVVRAIKTAARPPGTLNEITRSEDVAGGSQPGKAMDAVDFDSLRSAWRSSVALGKAWNSAEADVRAQFLDWLGRASGRAPG